MAVPIMLLVIIAAFADLMALSAIKEYSRTKKYEFFIIAVLMYIFICLLMAYIFTLREMAVINSLWNAFSVILVLIAGYIFFKEKVTVNEIIGIILIIIATILISYRAKT